MPTVIAVKFNSSQVWTFIFHAPLYSFCTAERIRRRSIRCILCLADNYMVLFGTQYCAGRLSGTDCWFPLSLEARHVLPVQSHLTALIAAKRKCHAEHDGAAV
jgi:hypothetical protein